MATNLPNCPQCGGPLDSTQKKKKNCPYCETPFPNNNEPEEEEEEVLELDNEVEDEEEADDENAEADNEEEEEPKGIIYTINNTISGIFAILTVIVILSAQASPANFLILSACYLILVFGSLPRDHSQTSAFSLTGIITCCVCAIGSVISLLWKLFPILAINLIIAVVVGALFCFVFSLIGIIANSIFKKILVI